MLIVLLHYYYTHRRVLTSNAVYNLHPLVATSHTHVHLNAIQQRTLVGSNKHSPQVGVYVVWSGEYRLRTLLSNPAAWLVLASSPHTHAEYSIDVDVV